ncbi:MAG: hypothetical protein LBS69_03650 [Prevotellaceae bacterium]|jgi:hypothetical protein|nr:hypothetical protein [Prevotellaceae bacterium]
MTWFELFQPGKAAALEAEERLNNAKIEANAEQNQLEALMSLQLTKEDNKKMLIVIGMVVLALVIYIKQQ